MSEAIRIEKEELPREETQQETLHVASDQVMSTIKRLLKEANVRRLVVKNAQGRTLVEVPVALGAVGMLMAPFWVGLGVVVALVSDCSIVVERVVDEPPAKV